MLDRPETKGDSVQPNVVQRKGPSEVPELRIKTRSGNVSFAEQNNPITAATAMVKILLCHL